MSNKWLGIPIHTLSRSFVPRIITMVLGMTLLLVGLSWASQKTIGTLTGANRYTLRAPRSTTNGPVDSPEVERLRTLVGEQQSQLGALYGQITELQRKLDHITTLKQAVDSRLTEAGSIIGGLENEVESLQVKIGELNAQIATLSSKSNQLIAEKKAAEKAKALADKARQKAEAHAARSDRATKRARTELKKATRQITSLSRRNTEMEAMLADARGRPVERLHSFVSDYWRKVNRCADRAETADSVKDWEPELEGLMAAWVKPRRRRLIRSIKSLDWARLTKVTPKVPRKADNGDMSTTAYICLTLKDKEEEPRDFAGTMRFLDDGTGWKIRSIRIKEGPCS